MMILYQFDMSPSIQAKYSKYARTWKCPDCGYQIIACNARSLYQSKRYHLKSSVSHRVWLEEQKKKEDKSQKTVKDNEIKLDAYVSLSHYYTLFKQTIQTERVSGNRFITLDARNKQSKFKMNSKEMIELQKVSNSYRVAVQQKNDLLQRINMCLRDCREYDPRDWIVSSKEILKRIETYISHADNLECLDIVMKANSNQSQKQNDMNIIDEYDYDYDYEVLG